jgi:ankyrin repeat protein
MANDAPLWKLFTAIASADDGEILDLLAATPAFAYAVSEDGATRVSAVEHYLSGINHYVYAGDTALHLAAAAHRPPIVRELIRMGAEVAAKNRHDAQPLHYAADGLPGSLHWRPAAQAETIACLIASGADPNAVDRRRVTPLHRAVRTRCAEAVSALLQGGADPLQKNKQGSTPMTLATQPTGRGGTGSVDAKAQQAEIILLLERYAERPA